MPTIAHQLERALADNNDLIAERDLARKSALFWNDSDTIRAKNNAAICTERDEAKADYQEAHQHALKVIGDLTRMRAERNRLRNIIKAAITQGRDSVLFNTEDWLEAALLGEGNLMPDRTDTELIDYLEDRAKAFRESDYDAGAMIVGAVIAKDCHRTVRQILDAAIDAEKGE